MNDTLSSSTGSGGETVSSPDVSDRSGESWLDRLMTAVGLKSSTADLRESLETVLGQDGGADPAFTPLERSMIRKILGLREIRVEDVMLPRSAITAIRADSDLATLMMTFSRTGHSRMPIYVETLDDAIGMIHIRDLMNWIARAATASQAVGEAPPATVSLAAVDLSTKVTDTDLVRPVLFVPASMPATDLLAKMQANRMQIALVIDEYGGVDGLVSMEDIVETVVGDIEDEHDTQEGEGRLVASGQGIWIVDGSVELDEVSEETGIDFGPSGLAEDVDTLGGLAFALFGRVPRVGEELVAEELPGVVFEVLEADARRIKSLRLRLVPQGVRPAPEAAADPVAPTGS